MLSIDGLGLGVNWQRFLSETLNPVVAPPPRRRSRTIRQPAPRTRP
jgi:hypothetical protein